LLPLHERHGVATRVEAGRADWWPALLLTPCPWLLITGLLFGAWHRLTGAAAQ